MLRHIRIGNDDSIKNFNWMKVAKVDSEIKEIDNILYHSNKHQSHKFSVVIDKGGTVLKLDLATDTALKYIKEIQIKLKEEKKMLLAESAWFSFFRRIMRW